MLIDTQCTCTLGIGEAPISNLDSSIFQYVSFKYAQCVCHMEVMIVLDLGHSSGRRISNMN